MTICRRVVPGVACIQIESSLWASSCRCTALIGARKSEKSSSLPPPSPIAVSSLQTPSVVTLQSLSDGRPLRIDAKSCSPSLFLCLLILRYDNECDPFFLQLHFLRATRISISHPCSSFQHYIWLPLLLFLFVLASIFTDWLHHRFHFPFCAWTAH